MRILNLKLEGYECELEKAKERSNDADNVLFDVKTELTETLAKLEAERMNNQNLPGFKSRPALIDAESISDKVLSMQQWTLINIHGRLLISRNQDTISLVSKYFKARKNPVRSNLKHKNYFGKNPIYFGFIKHF